MSMGPKSMKQAVRTLGAMVAAFIVGISLIAGGPAAAGPLGDAKQQGWVGEKPDGYVGVVKPGAPGNVQTLVNQVNAGRSAEYQRIATANGIFYPAAVALFAYCLKGYRRSAEEIGKWELAD